ncbi:MAG: 2-iminoacetate synthase ThiH [Puniceicoccales bacterium]|jgi:2-iminoacetate synthase|nr:2-iminoacetate synthase ThiH [Puniceicoccales bacterium]
MSFLKTLERHRWDDVRASILSHTAADVERALGQAAAGRCSLDALQALLSPAATPYLEPMLRLAWQKTLQRFGRTVQLFAPLYVSNECHNICSYCGFSMENKIPRKILTDAELLREAGALKKLNFDHVLVVSGESAQKVGMPYFEHALALLRPHFANISLEVQPLDTADYAKLRTLGLSAVLVYQETYNREDYHRYHLKGRKADFDYRVETPDRLGEAGVHKIGLGALYGLEDWRVDSFFVALHLDYLEHTYWRSRYSIAFPRLRPHAGGLEPKVEMTDHDLAQAICAFRLFSNEVEISLTTREAPRLRDHAMRLGVTTMSAGAKTNPGGYSNPGHPDGKDSSLEQFHMADERSPEAIAAMLRSQGYEPVWKDWDPCYDIAV